MGLSRDARSRVPTAWVKRLKEIDKKGKLMGSVKYGPLLRRLKVNEVAVKNVRGGKITIVSKGEKYYISNRAPDKDTDLLFQELQRFKHLKEICSRTSLFDQPQSKEDTTPLDKKELREILQKHTIAINLLTHRAKESSAESRYIGAPPELLLACAAISVGAMDTFIECWKLISSEEEERLESALELITNRISENDNVDCITELATIINMWSSADDVASLRHLIPHSGPTNTAMYNHRRFANPEKTMEFVFGKKQFELIRDQEQGRFPLFQLSYDVVRFLAFGEFKGVSYADNTANYTADIELGDRIDHHLGEARQEVAEIFEEFKERLSFLEEYSDDLGDKDDERKEYDKAFEEFDAILTADERKLTVENMLVDKLKEMENNIEAALVSTGLIGEEEGEFQSLWPTWFKTERGSRNWEEEKTEFVASIKEFMEDSKDLRDKVNAVREIHEERDEASLEKTDTNLSAEVLQFWRDWNKRRKEVTNREGAEQLLEEVTLRAEELMSDIQSIQSSDRLSKHTLWIGLGEGGCNVTRDSILWCAENLNDGRSETLLRSMGMDDTGIQTIRANERVRALKQEFKEGEMDEEDDESIRKQVDSAEEDLAKLFGDRARLIAINLGHEIKQLSTKHERGWWMWGLPSSYQRSSGDARWLTNNTIGLFFSSGEDGAGQAMGRGRIRGRQHGQYIQDILKITGQKSGSKSPPQDIILCHSYAGGSGSGLVLPVIEYCRAQWGPTPYIWVISIGESVANENWSARVNTPYVSSEVLQSHYGAIHTVPIPLTSEEWRGERIKISAKHKVVINGAKDIFNLIGDELKSEEADIVKLWNDNNEGLASYVERAGETETNRVKNSEEGTPESVDRSTIWAGLERLVGKKYEEDGSADSAWRDGALSQAALKRKGGFFPEPKESKAIRSQHRKDMKEHGRSDIYSFIATQCKPIFKHLLRDPMSYIMQDTVQGRRDTDTEEVISVFLKPETIHELANFIYQTFEDKKDDLPEPDFTNYQLLSECIGSKCHWLAEAIKSSIGDLDPTKAVSTLRKYGNSLRELHEAQYSLIVRLRNIAESTRDERIKMIIFNNRQLEQGAKAAGLLEGGIQANPHILYNSVLLDSIMTMLGTLMYTSEGPAQGSFTSETLDRQDLNQRTGPPLLPLQIQSFHPSALGRTINLSGPYHLETVREIKPETVAGGNIDGITRNLAFLFIREKLISRYLDAGSINVRRPIALLFNGNGGYLSQINPEEVLGIKLKSEWKNRVAEFAEEFDDLDSLNSQAKKGVRSVLNNTMMRNILYWLGTIPPQLIVEFVIPANNKIEKLTSERSRFNDWLEWTGTEGYGTPDDFEDVSLNLSRSTLTLQRWDSIFESAMRDNDALEHPNETLFRVLYLAGVRSLEHLQMIGLTYPSAAICCLLRRFAINTKSVNAADAPEEPEQLKKYSAKLDLHTDIREYYSTIDSDILSFLDSSDLDSRPNEWLRPEKTFSFLYEGDMDYSSVLGALENVAENAKKIKKMEKELELTGLKWIPHDAGHARLILRPSLQRALSHMLLSFSSTGENREMICPVEDFTSLISRYIDHTSDVRYGLDKDSSSLPSFYMAKDWFRMLNKPCLIPGEKFSDGQIRLLLFARAGVLRKPDYTTLRTMKGWSKEAWAEAVEAWQKEGTIPDGWKTGDMEKWVEWEESPMKKLMSSVLLKPWSEEESEIERFVKERDVMLEKLDESGSKHNVEHENFSLSNERTILAHRIVILAKWARNEFQLIKARCEKYAEKSDDSSLGSQRTQWVRHLHEVSGRADYFQTFWTLATLGRGDFDTNDEIKQLSKASIEFESIIDVDSTSVVNSVMFKDAIECIEGNFIEKISSLNSETPTFAIRLESTSATFFNWNYLKSTLLKFHDMKLEYENQDKYLSGERLSSVRFPIMGCMDHIQGTVRDFLLLPCYSHNPPEASPSNRAAYCAVRSSFCRLVEGKTYGKLSWDGPQSLAVMFFNKAPSGEIAQRMLEMQITTVQGNDEHLKSCIHPTLYAYNILWLSIELPMWCSGGTEDFYRKMQFSPDFIKRMFSTPDMHEFQAADIEAEQLGGFADLPEKDVVLVGDHIRTWQDRRSMLQLLFKASVRSVLAVCDKTRPSHGEFVLWANELGGIKDSKKIKKDDADVIVEIATLCSKFASSTNKWKQDLANNCLITEHTDRIFGHDDEAGNSPLTRAVQYWHSLKKWDEEISDAADRELESKTPSPAE